MQRMMNRALFTVHIVLNSYHMPRGEEEDEPGSVGVADADETFDGEGRDGEGRGIDGQVRQVGEDGTS